MGPRVVETNGSLVTEVGRWNGSRGKAAVVYEQTDQPFDQPTVSPAICVVTVIETNKSE